jgi:CheY-like chemotaxis protein
VYQVDPQIPQVLLGDDSRLKQVLHNLVGNAVKFTEHGEVVLRVTQERRAGDEIELCFAVSDTGIGIPPEKQQLIFEAFSQGDPSTTRKFGGTGLGLAISSRIVELMGGSMSVVSNVGKGSTFYFTARMQVPTQASAAKAETPKELQGMSALIVDDNLNSRAVLDQMLSAWGIQASTAASAEEALSMLATPEKQNSQYQLLVIDSRMPGMDGFSLVANIAKQRTKSAIVMMLTSDDYKAGVRRCHELGINSYLIKPVKRCELLAAIRRAMAPEAEILTASPQVQEHLGQFRILLAEDNLVNQRLAVGLLEKMGHRVTVAQNGREALDLLQDRDFDLVLMDVQMPEMDGFAATKELRKREQGQQRHIPVIAMTAHAMKGDRETCIAAGMDGYIAKPINRADLQQVIQEAVRVSEAMSGRG